MITDSQTNFLYLADTLPVNFRDFFPRLEKVLSECNIKFELLPGTKDVWAVDYMPIQTDVNRFVRFVYNPTYLQRKEYINTISDVDSICTQIGIKTIKSDLVVDGGNVIRSENKVIMTDRVFEENPTRDRKLLIRELYELLQVDHIYFIPSQPDDFTGHADGMVRFVDENTVLVNDYSLEKKKFRSVFEMAIHNTGLNVVQIPYSVYHNKSDDYANGIYMNYLQMGKTIILPTFDMKEDDLAFRKFEEIFPGHTIRTIESNDLAYEGGILNCISWNVKVED